jgi:hypothetical protein
VQIQRENHAIRTSQAGQELKSQTDSDIRIGRARILAIPDRVPESRCRLWGGIPTFGGLI